MAPERLHDQWLAANQAHLQASANAIVDLLYRYAETGQPLTADDVAAALQARCADLKIGQGMPTAMDHLASIFGLTPLERRILLLCLAFQIAPRAGRWWSEHGIATGVNRAGIAPQGPSFGLMRDLWDDVDWQVFLPTAPLRHWRILEVQQPTALLTSPLTVDERILHYTMGLQAPDERIAAALEADEAETVLLSPSQETQVTRLLPAWKAAAPAVRPLVRLEGRDPYALLGAAHMLGSTVAGGVLRCRPANLVPPAGDLEDALRLMEREALLQNRLLLVEGLDAAPLAEKADLLSLWVENLSGGAMITAIPSGFQPRRPEWVLRLGTPTREEQAALWQTELVLASPMAAAPLAEAYDLPAETIRRICASVRLDATLSAAAVVARAEEHCRRDLRPHLTGLAQRLPARATWDDLIVPDVTRDLLRAIPGQVRHRHRVFDEWAFRRKTPRGKGIAALFCGPSGTGKTLAAEILAHELRMDLYQVDLSQVVSKYIGDTEKHLARIFDAAEQGGCILLLDEADALFGKRSEVRDSHDRHANIEVSYLLQRLETFSGLALLTTNKRAAIDEAFLRRFRTIVSFPFPDREQRQAIWATIFPDETPVADLDPTRLAQLSISGGSIHNIALQAAFLAAQNGGRVEMDHIAAAARMEYAKLERPFTAAETGGWL